MTLVLIAAVVWLWFCVNWSMLDATDKTFDARNPRDWVVALLAPFMVTWERLKSWRAKSSD